MLPTRGIITQLDLASEAKGGSSSPATSAPYEERRPMQPAPASPNSDDPAWIGLPFVKMHGLGNDYVYLDEREANIPRNLPELSRQLSDRHRGIGADGIIVLRADPEHACFMEMYNADGSRAEMCGNGIRCVAELAHRRVYSARDQFVVGSDAGPREVWVERTGPTEARVRVEMGPARVGERLSLESDGRTFSGVVVDLGNPHFVIELEESPHDLDLPRYGPPLESHDRFPDRINVEFVQVVSPKSIQFRVWERGSGETQACGTGATAVVAALHAEGRCESSAVVHLLGGDLDIEVAESGQTFMTGPAVQSFSGVVTG